MVRSYGNHLVIFRAYFVHFGQNIVHLREYSAYNDSAHYMKLRIIKNQETLMVTGINDYLYAYAFVTQLDRVSASEAECRVFKSPRAHHIKK